MPVTSQDWGLQLAADDEGNTASTRGNKEPYHTDVAESGQLGDFL